MSSLNSYQEIDLKIDLHSYWLAFKRRLSLAVIIFVSINTFLYIYLNAKKPYFKSSGIVLIKPQNSSSMTGLETFSTEESEVLGKQSDPLITEMEVIRSYPVLQETSSIVSANGTYINVSDIQEGIEIEPLPGTDMLKISYQSLDPNVAAAVANILIEVYIEMNVRDNRAKASNAREFIEAQLPKTAAAVREAERKLSLFKQQNNIVTLDNEVSQSVKTIAELENMMAEFQAQLAGLSAQSTAQITAPGSRKNNLSPNVQEMAEQLGQIQKQLAKERKSFQSQHPSIVHLEQEEAELKAQIYKAQSDDVEVQRQSLEKQIKKLSELQAEQKAKAKNYPQLEKTNRELERNLSAAQITYESLLKKLQEVRVAENQTIGNVQIVSPPQVPEKPVETFRTLILASGSILALLLSLAIVFTIDILDRSVKDIKQARNLLGYPLVGVIPYFTTSTDKKLLSSFETEPKPEAKSKAGRVFTENNPLHLSMILAYNGLQANLNSLSLDKGAKVIAVTSSVSNEGKSEVSANLAAALARAGRRVLLVDANRYQPSQHNIWGLENPLGLSEVIEGQTDLQSVLQEVLPNLFLLPRGNVSAGAIISFEARNINEIKSNEMYSLSTRLFLNDLIGKVSNDYDAIIFDTPSIIDAMDASFLSQIADRTLFVVRPGIVDISSIKIAKQILSSSNWEAMGIIANSIDENDPHRFSSLQSTDAKVKTIPSLYYQKQEF